MFLDRYCVFVESNFLQATVEEIKAAYKRLALTYHPDIHSSVSTEPEMLEAAQQQFTLIKEAYETLVDEKRRKLYEMYGLEGVRTGWELATKYASTEEVCPYVSFMNTFFLSKPAYFVCSLFLVWFLLIF